MSKLLISLGIGVIAGVIDVIPMVIRNTDKYTVLAAFVHWVVVGVLISYVQMPGPHWLKGIVVAVVTTLPVLILRARDGPSSILPILAMSIVLGAAAGFASGRFAH